MSMKKKMIRLLPEAIRISLMRNTRKLKLEWPDSLEIKIADTQEELESAFNLLHNSYVKSGFMTPDPTNMRVLPQHLLPETTTIVAKWKSKVVGTISLIRDNPIGLPLEKAFNINDRRLGGRRLAEVSSLTIAPEFRGHSNKVLYPLIRFLIHYARYYFGVHELVIAVNPKSADFYKGLLCFESLTSKVVPYNFVNGAPAIGLFLDFETADERWLETFGSKATQKNFYRYWATVPNHPQNKLPVRMYHSAADPVLTPKLLKNFFLDKTGIVKLLSKHEIKVLIDSYPYPAFQNILRPLMDKYTRKNERFDTDMVAFVSEGLKKVDVFNVSLEGLMLRSKMQKFERGHVFNLEVWLNDAISTRIKIEVINVKEHNLYGLKIVEGTLEWHDMIHCLSQKSHEQFELVHAA
jgi:hypothetical protein